MICCERQSRHLGANTGDGTVTSTLTSPDVLPYSEFLTDEHQAIREMVRDFATREIAPISAQVDKNAVFPEATFKGLGKLDLLGLLVPSEYGGAGADYRSYAIAVEEIARAL
jgi:alkylation response protein AidB-like acyl-CoA dehydrogenase